MHPVNDTNFGVHGLKVRYNDGLGSTVNGYIVEQNSQNRFTVAGTALAIGIITVQVGGTGMTPGKRTFTVSGGTGLPATFTATVSDTGTVIPNTIVKTFGGVYSALPTSPVSCTVDTGSAGSATFAITSTPAKSIVKLAPTTALATASPLAASTYNPFNPGYFTIEVTPGAGATFTANYGASAATIATAGTFYRVGDVLSAPSGGATFAVATLASSTSVLASVAIATPGSGLTNGTVTFTVAGGTGTPATFTATVSGGAVTAITGIVNVGSYTAFPTGANSATGSTGGTPPTFNLTSALAGPIATVTVSTPGAYAAKLANPVAVTGGAQGSSGTAALTVTYKLVSVTASGGMSYTAGQTLLFTGIAGGTPAAHISAVDPVTGAPTAIVVDTPSSGITTFATSVTATGGTAQHVKKLNGNKLLTTEGNTFAWALGNVGMDSSPSASVSKYS